MIRVLLVEDHAALRDALAAVIAMTDGLEVSGVLGGAGGDAAAELQELASRSDVAIVDLDLPGGSGVEVIAALRAADPPIACLVLTGLRDDRELGLAIEAGAAAVMHKSTPMPSLLEAVREVAGGGSVLPAAETSRRLQALAAERDREWRGKVLREQLTPRELELLEHLVYGLDTAQIADALTISPDTVKTHARNLLAKLGAKTRLEAVSIGLQHGLVDPP